MILGIDPGYATLGYAFLKGKITPEVVDVGVITTPKEEIFSARLLEIENNLLELIKKHQPDLAVVEKIFFKNNQKTAINVAQARGAVLLILARNKIETSEYTPLQVKKSIALKGNAAKKEVAWMVKKILNLKTPIKQDDATDALALALSHWYFNH